MILNIFEIYLHCKKLDIDLFFYHHIQIYKIYLNF